MKGMTKYKCLIIEDEPLAAELIKSYIEKVPYLELVAIYENAIKAFPAMLNQLHDVLFIDIEMPGMSGLELLRSLPRTPHVIIISAYKEHAIEGFDLDVTDFVLKPMSFERFMKAIGKLSRQMSNKEEKEISIPAAADPYLFFRVNKENIKLYLKDILWIESFRDYIKIVTADKELMTYERISVIEQKLPESLFTRIHRSFIVANQKVEAVTATHLRIGENMLPISRNYRLDFMKKFRS
jgi:DNA-binding LytR/AlgR family response regulator